MEIVSYNGWKNNVRLSNREVELIVTKDVGPRVIRFGFIGEKNMFAEFKRQQGKSGEKEWMIRGGHRFWIAPEEKPKTYELDNVPIRTEEIRNGVRTVQPVGLLSKMRKIMEISLSLKSNEVTVVHKLTNMSKKTVQLAPWALSVMAPKGMAVIPLPGRIPHTKRLTHNQEWSLWGYTDFTDSRWTIGSRYLFFRQDMTKGPNKLGIAHREGWVAYQLSRYMFVKRFKWITDAAYPDGGVNFETFSNEQMLEIESLGPLVSLPPDKSVTHEEKWSLHRDVPLCKSEADADRNILPIISKLA
jgi:hypothetical protein